MAAYIQLKYNCCINDSQNTVSSDDRGRRALQEAVLKRVSWIAMDGGGGSSVKWSGFVYFPRPFADLSILVVMRVRQKVSITITDTDRKTRNSRRHFFAAGGDEEAPP